MAYGTIRADIIEGTNVTLDLSVAGQYEFTGDLLPDSDDSRDLGSSSLRWANIYTGDLHLANDRGDWTMIEEETYLSLRNNKTGKVFKLVMEEVEG